MSQRAIGAPERRKGWDHGEGEGIAPCAHEGGGGCGGGGRGEWRQVSACAVGVGGEGAVTILVVVTGGGHGRRGWIGRGRCVVGEPLPEETHGHPVEEISRGADALAGAGGEVEAEEATFDARDSLLELVDLVLDNVEDRLGQRGPQTSLAGGPLAHDVYQCL